jgi:hypothetical protein
MIKKMLHIIKGSADSISRWYIKIIIINNVMGSRMATKPFAMNRS